MASRLLILMIAMTTAGCVSGSTGRRPGQDQAEKIVWRAAFGMTDAAPEVEWIQLDDWNAGERVEGFTWAGWKIQVADGDPANPVKDCAPDGQWLISSTSYAHELMHYKMAATTGDVDAFHLRGDWHLADDVVGQRLIDAGL